MSKKAKVYCPLMIKDKERTRLMSPFLGKPGAAFYLSSAPKAICHKHFHVGIDKLITVHIREDMSMESIMAWRGYDTGTGYQLSRWQMLVMIKNG